MLPVGGLPIRHLERALVWEREDALQQFNFGDGLFRIHTISILDAYQPQLRLHNQDETQAIELNQG
jgi:hypothetical protein